MEFYVIDTPKADSSEGQLGGIRAIKEEGFTTGAAVRCPRCNRFLTMLKWLPPYRIELERWGRGYGDFASIGQDMIVSERFLLAFQDSGLNGLSPFEPVEVVKVIDHGEGQKQPLPRYFTSSVTLSPTTVDQEASGYVWADKSKVCPACLFDRLKRFARIVMKEETWNGDDIFYPRGGTRLMISERFKAFCKQHAFLNVVFRSPEQENYDYFPWETHGSNER